MSEHPEGKPTLAALREAIDCGDFGLAEQLLRATDPDCEVREVRAELRGSIPAQTETKIEPRGVTAALLLLPPPA